jgi:hypothetical protein
MRFTFSPLLALAVSVPAIGSAMFWATSQRGKVVVRRFLERKDLLERKHPR